MQIERADNYIADEIVIKSEEELFTMFREIASYRETCVLPASATLRQFLSQIKDKYHVPDSMCVTKPLEDEILYELARRYHNLHVCV